MQELSDKIATREVVRALGEEMRVRIGDIGNGLTEINGLVKDHPEQASAQVKQVNIIIEYRVIQNTGLIFRIILKSLNKPLGNTLSRSFIFYNIFLVKLVGSLFRFEVIIGYSLIQS